MVLHRVRELAEARGYRPSRLARRADLSLKTVYGLWNDQRADLRASTLLKLARTLQVGLVELVEWGDEGEG